MSSLRMIQDTVAAVAVCTAVSISAAHANDKAIFHDVLKPNGHARSTAAKFADAATCGMAKSHEIKVIMPVFEKCMAAKGWAFDHYQANPKARPRYGTNVAFTDTIGDANRHPRGNAALQADTRTCKAGYRDEESRTFKHCMAAHGWQYMYAQHAPVRYLPVAPYRYGYGYGYAEWGNSSSSSEPSGYDHHNEEAAANIQAASDAINAAIAATNAQQAQDAIINAQH